jgi:hypothetical protein
MDIVSIVCIITIIYLTYYFLFPVQVTETEIIIIEPEQLTPIVPIVPEQVISVEEQDLIQHNKLVKEQLDTYLAQTKIPNYTEDSISLGTAKLYDYKDTM